MQRMNKLQLIILNDVGELRKLHIACENMAAEWLLPEKISMNINLVLEEIISNIIFYGYADDLEHEIKIDFRKENKEIIISITDDGKAFDMLSVDVSAGIDMQAEERKIGGLGIHFVKTLMDSVEYRREGNMNILTLHKNI